jgi:hypothetical protein
MARFGEHPVMGSHAGLGGFSFRHRARPVVLCASCGTRFDADGATLCAEVVELDGVRSERRHYRSRVPLEFGGGRPVTRRAKKRAVVGSVPTPVVLIVFTLVVLFAIWVAFPDLSPVAALHHFTDW